MLPFPARTRTCSRQVRRGRRSRRLLAQWTPLLSREKSRTQGRFSSPFGFETTAPETPWPWPKRPGLGSRISSVLVSQVLVPPAIEANMTSPDCRVQGFLAAGHVCTVMGTAEYEPLARCSASRSSSTGFEPSISFHALRCASASWRRTSEIENQYTRSVRPEGNPAAIRQVCEVFEVSSRNGGGSARFREAGSSLRSNTSSLTRRGGSASTRSRPTNRPSVMPGWSCRAEEAARVSGVRSPLHPGAPLGAPMVSRRRLRGILSVSATKAGRRGHSAVTQTDLGRARNPNSEIRNRLEARSQSFKRS